MRHATRTAIAVLGLAACACGSSPPDREGPDKPGGKLTMLWAYDTQQIDCGATYYTVDWMLCWATQRPLYNYRPDGAGMVPDLAVGAPAGQEDGRTVTVRIRSGSASRHLSAGRSARDVKYAIERGFYGTINNGYAETYFGALVGARTGVRPGTRIRGLEVPDDRTLVLHLSRPTGGILAAGALALPLTAPFPRSTRGHSTHAIPRLWAPPGSDGPVHDRQRRERQGRRLRPGASDPFGSQPELGPAHGLQAGVPGRDRSQTGNQETSIAALRVLEGKALVAGDFHPPPAVLKRAREERPAQLTMTPGSGTRYVALNTSVAPFDDLNVRKAVLAGFDREALRLVLGGRRGTSRDALPAPVRRRLRGGGRRQGPGYDFLSPDGKPMAEVAAAYLRKAGHASGRYSGGKRVLMVGSHASEDARIAEVARTSLERIGFDVQLRLVSYGTLLTRYCGTPAADVAICPSLGWVADFADGQAMLAPTFGGDYIQEVGNANVSQLDDVAVDEAMRQAELLTDPSERAHAWGEIDRQVTGLAPAVPWLWDNGIVLASDDVRMAVNPASGLPDLAHVALR